MKICVVGEGPVGLVITLLFIYYKKKYSLNNMYIFLYKSRPSFERRHVINVNKDLMEEIEGLIANCSHCLLQELSESTKEQITMSINCLETILYNKIDKDLVTIIPRTNFTEDEQYSNNYDHLFLCDGFQSKNRTAFVYDRINYSPIKCVFFDKVILVFYTNLRPVGTPVTEDCINNVAEKKMFNAEELSAFKVDFDMLVAMISIIYNINNRYNSLPKIEGINLIERNLWGSGFQNYDEFVSIFEDTIKYFSNTKDNNVIFNVFRQFNVNMTDNMKYLFENKAALRDVYNNYKLFIKSELDQKNASNTSFMVHCVTPNCVSHGIILDNNVENLLYCKRIKKDTYAWLVGDSASAYPPGYSLVLGLKDSFFLVKQFLKLNFKTVSEFNELPNLPLDYNLFDCDKATKKYTENFMTLPKTCEYVKNLKFVDGYINSNVSENDKLKSMSDIMTIIKSKKCFDLIIKPNSNVNEVLVNIYNLYQLNNFFNNIITIFCQESAGGKRGKRKNNKKQKGKGKTNKRKSIKKKRKTIKRRK